MIVQGEQSHESIANCENFTLKMFPLEVRLGQFVKNFPPQNKLL